MNKSIKSLFRVFICTIIIAGSALSNLEAAGNRGRKISRISRNKRMVKRAALSRVRAKNKRPAVRTQRRPVARKVVRPACPNGACARRVVYHAQQAEAASAPLVEQPLVVAAPVAERIVGQTVGDHGCMVRLIDNKIAMANQPAADVLIHVRDTDTVEGQVLEASLRSAGGPEFTAVLDTPFPHGLKDAPQGSVYFIPNHALTNVKEIAFVGSPQSKEFNVVHASYIKTLKQAQLKGHKTVAIRMVPTAVRSLEQYNQVQLLINALCTYIKNNDTGFTEVRFIVDKPNFSNYLINIKKASELSYLARAGRYIRGRFTTTR